MKIETKFDVGQDIWFMEDNRPTKQEITKISIDIVPNFGLGVPIILYHYGCYDNCVNKIRCYGSRKELVESLMEE